MNKDERDAIDDLFDRSEWPVGARTGRQPSEPNQQALPGTLAAAIEMSECRGITRHRDAGAGPEPRQFPKVHCPLCDRIDGHAEGCGIETLNAMIDQDFLYGNVKEVSARTVEEIKAEAEKCRVVIVVGGGPSLPAGLLATLGNLPGVRMVTEQHMLKEREIVGERLHLDYENQRFAELADEVITGHSRALAMHELRAQWHNNVTLPSNRSETGRHGPKDSFHRKKKKGRS